MFFGQSVKMWMGGLFNTHPPLDERIRRVNPRFEVSDYRRHARQRCCGGSASRRGETHRPPVVGPFRGLGAHAGAERGAGRHLDAGKVDYASRLLAALPAGLRDALRDPEQAGAVLVALLLAQPEAAMERQLQAIPGASLAARARAAAPLHARPRPRLPPAGDRPRARRAQAAAGRGEARGAGGDRGGDPCRPPRVAARVRGAHAAAQPAAGAAESRRDAQARRAAAPRQRRCSRSSPCRHARRCHRRARGGAAGRGRARAPQMLGIPAERAVAGGAHAGFGQPARSTRCAASRRCRKACW